MTSLYESLDSAESYLHKNPGAGEVFEVAIETRPGIERPRVYALKDFCLLGENALLSSATGTVLRESTIYSHIELAFAGLKTGPVEVTEYKSGDYVALYGTWACGFWHWMLEWLPKAILAERAGFTGKYIVLPFQPYTLDSLQMIGIPPERIELHDGKNWQVQRLFVPQAIQGAPTLANYPGLIMELRERLIGATLRSGHKLSTDQRIYISRKDARRGRDVCNAEELSALLDRYGFQTVVMSNLSLAEQIARVARATAVVGPHGAGMLHTLFMRPASFVAEFFAPNYVNPVVLSIMRTLKHRYHMIVSPFQGLYYPHGSQIQVHLEVLETNLQREIDL